MFSYSCWLFRLFCRLLSLLELRSKRQDVRGGFPVMKHLKTITFKIYFWYILHTWRTKEAIESFHDESFDSILRFTMYLDPWRFDTRSNCKVPAAVHPWKNRPQNFLLIVHWKYLRAIRIDVVVYSRQCSLTQHTRVSEERSFGCILRFNCIQVFNQTSMREVLRRKVSIELKTILCFSQP